MSGLLSFIKGFADKNIADRDEERRRLAKMDEEERKLMFAQKLEEQALKRKPVGSRFENGQMVYFNAYGETVFQRPATKQEQLSSQAAEAELGAKIHQNSPERLKAEDERAKLKDQAYLRTQEAQARAANASAAEADQRRKVSEYELGATQDIMGDLGPPSGRGFPGAIGAATGRGAGASSLRYNAGDLANVARVEGALIDYANNVEKDPNKVKEIKGIIESTKSLPLDERIQILNATAAQLGIVKAD
jgi:hypothetical protein